MRAGKEGWFLADFAVARPVDVFDFEALLDKFGDAACGVFGVAWVVGADAIDAAAGGPGNIGATQKFGQRAVIIGIAFAFGCFVLRQNALGLW